MLKQFAIEAITRGLSITCVWSRPSSENAYTNGDELERCHHPRKCDGDPGDSAGPGAIAVVCVED